MPFGMKETKMVWLPDGEKKILTLRLFVSTEFTNVMDTQTNTHTHGHSMTAKAALDASIARQKPICHVILLGLISSPN